MSTTPNQQSGKPKQSQNRFTFNPVPGVLGRGNIRMPKTETDLRAERARANNSGVIDNTPIGKYYHTSMNRGDCNNTNSDCSNKKRATSAAPGDSLQGIIHSLTARLEDMQVTLHSQPNASTNTDERTLNIALLSTPPMAELPSVEPVPYRERPGVVIKPQNTKLQPITLPTFHKLFKLIMDTYERCLSPAFEIFVGGYKTIYHRDIFAAFSDITIIQEMPPTVIILSERIKPRALQLVYEWMRGKDIVVPSELLIPFCNAIDFLEIMDLQKQAWEYIDSYKHFDAFYIQPQPFCPNSPTLGLQRVCSYLVTNSIGPKFLWMVARDDFRELGLQEILTLLRLDDIGVNTEKEVFAVAVYWLQAKWNIRQEYLDDLMACIRFCLIPYAFFEAKPNRNSCVYSIVTHPRFESLMHDGCNSFDCTNCRKLIHDHRAPHHQGRKLGCTVYEFYDYFLQYINVLKLDFCETEV